MDNNRKLSFLHDGDYFLYNKKIYKVDWNLKHNNVVDIKNNIPCYINENTKVNWLRDFNIRIIK